MRMPKYVVLLLIFLASPVFAADSSPTEQSIKQLLAVTEARKLVDGVMSQVEGITKNTMQQALQGRTVTSGEQIIVDIIQRKIIAFLKQELNWDSIESIYVRICRDSLTQEEINGLLAFYKTPFGQASVKKMPAALQKTMAEMQTLKQEFNSDSFESAYIRTIRDSFTQEEIDSFAQEETNGLLAFYKTPSGQAMLKKMPVVMQKFTAEMQKLLLPLMQKIQQETLDELKSLSGKQLG